MHKRKQIPIALTIAGSDSGGGAGIQADLKTFAALGVHGTTAITCITAQNPKTVRGIQPCSVAILLRQLEAVFEELRPGAIKTGMLYSAPIIRAVAGFLHGLDGAGRVVGAASSQKRVGGQPGHGAKPGPRLKQRERRAPPLIVDPVMVSTSEEQLLKPAAMRALCTELLPLAALVTPNLQEAEILVCQKLRSVEDLRAAARQLHRQFGCAALVKGGHLKGLNQAVDIFYDGREELLLSAPFIRGVSTHGTGCTYSAAIASYLACGLSLSQAVQHAKEFITQAITQSQTAASHHVLNSFWR